MLAEEIVLHARGDSMDFMVVRFGNVLDSRGSIVPLFRRQIESGGPVTITDPRASRFFMTIPEAASLVLKAGGVGEGGTLYILDMGDPVMIRELAEQMIRFYGYEPGREIEVQTIGLRPGEKLEERLFSPDEQPVPTPYPRINRLIRRPRFNGELKKLLAALEPVCFFRTEDTGSYRNRHALRKSLQQYIPTVEVPEHEPEF
jgi:FlaA1/EpsC-like NDP-sugar epimerase